MDLTRKTWHAEPKSVPECASRMSPTETTDSRSGCIAGGVAGCVFYRSFTVGIVPYAGTAFLTWGYLRATLVPVGPDGRRLRATPLADLGIGALSGAVVQTVSYPFEVVRRRMQVGGLRGPGRWLRWGETVSGIWARGGPKGFFVGLGIGYLKIVPMNAVSFAVWRGTKRLLLDL
ncbi:mitochondrial carrier domain-containing protein [Lactarius indigo]|nr:mitochondrial carrier domain-containing protein [Lactarius indigo]